jgi:hypothetical protein
MLCNLGSYLVRRGKAWPGEVLRGWVWVTLWISDWRGFVPEPGLVLFQLFQRGENAGTEKV